MNQVCFHPIFNTFISCGSDGEAISWDPILWKWIWKKDFGVPLISVDFNESGTKLAVAGSYNYDNDEYEPSVIPEPMISILTMKESSVRNKGK